MEYISGGVGEEEGEWERQKKRWRGRCGGEGRHAVLRLFPLGGGNKGSLVSSSPLRGKDGSRSRGGVGEERDNTEERNAARSFISFSLKERRQRSPGLFLSSLWETSCWEMSCCIRRINCTVQTNKHKDDINK